jgi:ABC-type molybdenum transport system ATPase subunit/photorepair protein PhrA
MQLTELKTNIEQLRGRFKQLQIEQGTALQQLVNLEKEQVRIEEARTVIILVAQQTQQKVQLYISDVVTSALEMVLDEPYEFHVEFVQRRNKTECDLLFSRNGYEVNPLEASGGGAVNVASLALRVALLTLSKNDKILILDEPLHFLHSRVLHQRAAELLETLAKQNKIQIIMITGEEESTEIVSRANKVFRINKKKGVSVITED